MDEPLNLEGGVKAPEAIKKNVESGLNFFRLIGDVLDLYTGAMGKTAVDLSDILFENNKKTTSININQEEE